LGVHIHFCGHGRWRFRFYSESLGNTECRPTPSNQGLLPRHSVPRPGSACPHSGIAPGARRHRPSMAGGGYRGIPAAVPPAQRLRSASGKRGKQIRIKSQSNGNGKINSIASRLAPTLVGLGTCGKNWSADRPPSQRCGAPTRQLPQKISAHPESAPIRSAFHHTTGRALARLQLLILMHRALERPSGGSA
jgi:hypothetical protein